jgi:hypothetical protein
MDVKYLYKGHDTRGRLIEVEDRNGKLYLLVDGELASREIDDDDPKNFDLPEEPVSVEDMQAAYKVLIARRDTAIRNIASGTTYHSGHLAHVLDDIDALEEILQAHDREKDFDPGAMKEALHEVLRRHNDRQTPEDAGDIVKLIAETYIRHKYKEAA